MKKIKYISIALLATSFMGSCEKMEVDYDAIPVGDDMAQFQIGHYTPITTSAENNIYKVELDGKLLANNTNVLKYYNTIPGASRFYYAKPGKANLKLYQGTDLKLVFDQDITLIKGKQNVIVHDYNASPIILERNFDIPYPLDPSKATFDTDTIGYIRFIYLMYENEGQPTTMKLQYQYQYTLHPLYTNADKDAGLIPDGKKVGDATGDATKSAWLNLGSPVAFGESTGFQPVPVKKTTYIAQGAARIDFRIVVTAANGGVPGETVVDNVDWLLKVNGKLYTDYWNITIGRYTTHYFAGLRNKATVVKAYSYAEH